MDLQLQGKFALVTGSTAGIGLAIATALAREGACVIINGRSKASVDDVVRSVTSETGGTLVGFAGDLSLASTAEQLVREHPGVEILVNNLGIFEPKAFEDIPDAEWLRFFDVNVLSGVRLARLVLPSMRHANWGRLIFISSESGVQIPSEMIHYGVTKTALLAVSRGLAEAVAGSAITVNSILPGPTKSRGVGDFVGALAETLEDGLDHLVQAQPALGVQLGREPDLGVDHPVGGQVLGALRGHPPQRIRGLHDRDRVPERIEVNLQVTAVRAFSQPFRQLFRVVTGQVGVTCFAGQLKDGLRAQASVQVIMQQNLRDSPDLGQCQHPTIVHERDPALSKPMCSRTREI